MIASELRELAARAGLDGHEVDAGTPAALFARAERLADAFPADPARRVLVRAAHAWLTAGDGLPPVVGGVARETLLRWDATTTTWAGREVHSGCQALVRCLRPSAASDPAMRRALARDGRALRAALPALVHHEAAGALVLPVGAPAFAATRTWSHADPLALARLLVHTLAHLAAWERAGLGLGALDPGELRDAGDALVLAALTPFEAPDARRALSTTAAALRRWWPEDADDADLAALLDGLVAAPPATVADATAHLARALAEDLAARRHLTAARGASQSHESRYVRLASLVARLDDVGRPPAGEGVVGIDLDGHTLVVRSDGEVVTVGPIDAPGETVRDAHGQLQVSAARRLVHGAGAAPPSARLQAEAPGELEAAARIVRWVAAALGLRTLRKLLEAGGPA